MIVMKQTAIRIISQYDNLDQVKKTLSEISCTDNVRMLMSAYKRYSNPRRMILGSSLIRV